MLMCFECKEKIEEPDYIELDSRYYHKHHFKCKSCGCSLIDKDCKLTTLSIKDKQTKKSEKKVGLFCIPCYNKHCYPRCKDCESIITSDYLETFGDFYHPEHFCCSRCNKKLDDEYLRSKGRPVCEECFAVENQEICQECGLPVKGKRCVVDGKVWHHKCFKCKKCGKLIGKGKVVFYKGKPYHEDCFKKKVAPKCAFCKLPIEGDYIVTKKGKKKVHLGCIDFYKEMMNIKT